MSGESQCKQKETERCAINRQSILFAVLIIGIPAVVLFSLTIGSADLGMENIFRILGKALPVLGAHLDYEPDLTDWKIIFDIRLPRIILALLVGTSLSIAGVVFQALFRNPMADPYVIGTSSGAALGATLALVFHLDFKFFNLSTIPVMAFAGALLATLLVYNLAKINRKVPVTVLLLSGIAVASFLSSITSVLLILHKEEMHKVFIFLMGGFYAGRWANVVAILPYTALGIFLIAVFSRDLDILLLGEEKAQQLGMEINRLQMLLTFSASLLVAAAVSVSGTIAFVGLVIPHISRLISGPRHGYLIPAAALSGGLFLLIADTLARTIIAPLELPVGVITSFVGAPFFLYLLRTKKRSGPVL